MKIGLKLVAVAFLAAPFAALEVPRSGSSGGQSRAVHGNRPVMRLLQGLYGQGHIRWFPALDLSPGAGYVAEPESEAAAAKPAPQEVPDA